MGDETIGETKVSDHHLPLGPGRLVLLRVPEDLTKKEAMRVSSFVQAIAFDVEPVEQERLMAEMINREGNYGEKPAVTLGRLMGELRAFRASVASAEKE